MMRKRAYLASVVFSGLFIGALSWAGNPFDFIKDRLKPNTPQPKPEEQKGEKKPSVDPAVIEAVNRCKNGDITSCIDPFHCVIYGKGKWEGEWNASSPLKSEGRCVPELTRCIDLGEGAKDAVIERGER